MMRLEHPQRGDTGWRLELEVAFSRDPPLYDEGDESIEVECSVIEYWGKGAGEQGNPPLPIGHTLVMNVYVNNLHGLRRELMPLHFESDRASELFAFQRINMGTQAFSVGGKRCHGAVVFRIELDIDPYGTLSAEVQPVRPLCSSPAVLVMYV